jgi:hypothetical protein
MSVAGSAYAARWRITANNVEMHQDPSIHVVESDSIPQLRHHETDSRRHWLNDPVQRMQTGRTVLVFIARLFMLTLRPNSARCVPSLSYSLPSYRYRLDSSPPILAHQKPQHLTRPDQYTPDKMISAILLIIITFFCTIRLPC